MLTLDKLNRCRRGIDETSLALYDLIKELKADIATIEKDISWNEKMHFAVIAQEMTKKHDQMKAKLADYEHLQECCEKTIEHIKDSEKWAVAMK